MAPRQKISTARVMAGGAEPVDGFPDQAVATGREYRARWGSDVELLSFEGSNGFWSLFDVTGWSDNPPDKPAHRVVATWGYSKPDKRIGRRARLRNFPLPFRIEGPLDRGHLISLASGGGEDVNIIPQARRLNRGWSSQGRRWRKLERLCVAHSGSFMFLELAYSDLTDVPTVLDFMVTTPSGKASRQRFINVDR